MNGKSNLRRAGAQEDQLHGDLLVARRLHGVRSRLFDGDAALRPVLITGLVVFAAIKAVLVALYFMHLSFERKTLGILFASTLILGAILVSVGMAEHFLPRP